VTIDDDHVALYISFGNRVLLQIFAKQLPLAQKLVRESFKVFIILMKSYILFKLFL
jgi:hypothetical protein